MVFSTNQAIQFYDLTGRNGESTTATVKQTADKKKHFVELSIGGETFVSPTWDVALKVADKKAGKDVKKRKAFLVAVDASAVVDGEVYVLTITTRSAVGEEDTYQKYADYKAGASTTAVKILQGLAKSLLNNQKTEASPLYNLYLYNGTEIDASNVTSITNSGFYIVEPVPDWELGSFPETLEPMSVTANTIFDANGLEVDWLSDGNGGTTSVLEPLDGTVTPGVDPIYNTHTVADLEYFAQGERGNSTWQWGWPLNIKPRWKVDVDSAPYGYHILVAHVANVGNNQNSTLQEFDLVFALKDAGSSDPEESIPELLTDLATDIMKGTSSSGA